MQTGRKLESGWGGIPERDSQIFSEILSELSYQGLATVKTFIQMFSEIFLNFQKITKLINKAGAYFIPFFKTKFSSTKCNKKISEILPKFRTQYFVEIFSICYE